MKPDHSSSSAPIQIISHLHARTKAGEPTLHHHVHHHQAVIPVLHALLLLEVVILHPHPQAHQAHRVRQGLPVPPVPREVDVPLLQVAAVTGKSFNELKKN